MLDLDWLDDTVFAAYFADKTIAVCRVGATSIHGWRVSFDCMHVVRRRGMGWGGVGQWLGGWMARLMQAELWLVQVAQINTLTPAIRALPSLFCPPPGRGTHLDPP